MSVVLFNEDNEFDKALADNQDVKSVINKIIEKKEEEQVLLLHYLVRAFKLFKETNDNPSGATKLTQLIFISRDISGINLLVSFFGGYLFR
jgi:hypothetical protein